MAIKTEKDLSENALALWLKAKSAVERNNYGYANSLLQTVLKEAPEFLDGRIALRKSEIGANKGKKSFFSGFSTQALKGSQVLKKDPAAAMELAEKTLETDPHNAQANHLLKDAALALGHYEIATFALLTIVDGNPKDTKILHELGDLYYQHGEVDKAGDIYSKITQIDPSDLEAAKRSKDAAAQQTMKTGGWDTAKDYRDLIKNKDEAISYEQKNRVIKSDEMIIQQIAELSEQVQQQPENLDLSRRIAGLYEQRADLENSIAWYNYASELAKGSDNWLLRKVSDLQLKQIDNAIKEREEWLAAAGDTHEESARVRKELDDLKVKKSRATLEDCLKRVERNPTDLLFKYELGEQYMLLGEFTEAIPELQQALRNPNVRIKAMNYLGQCYAGKGMLDMAAKQFTTAAGELASMDAIKKEILYKLGLLYEKMGQKDKGLECFKEIYEVDYGYEDVAKRVESSYGNN